MEATVIYLFMESKIYQFKAEDSELFAYPICLGSISKDFSVANLTETGLNGYVHDFWVDYSDISVDNVLDIHKHLMKKKNMNNVWAYQKKCLSDY